MATQFPYLGQLLQFLSIFLSFRGGEFWVNAHFFLNWKLNSEALKQWNTPHRTVSSFFSFFCIIWKSHGACMWNSAGPTEWTGFAQTSPALCCRTTVAKGPLAYVASDQTRLNSLINSRSRWLSCSKVLFIGSKSNGVYVHNIRLEDLVQHLVLVKQRVI